MTQGSMTPVRAWTRWSDWAEVVLGVVAALSPAWFDTTTKATWTMVVLGALVAVDGLWSLAAPGVMASEGIEMALGVLLFISPWVMGYASLTGLAWSSWIIGVLTVAAAGVSLPSFAATHRLTGQH